MGVVVVVAGNIIVVCYRVCLMILSVWLHVVRSSSWMSMTKVVLF